MEEAKIFGMKMSSAVTILCILVILLIILIIFIIHKMNVMARKYEMLMSGKKVRIWRRLFGFVLKRWIRSRQMPDV